MSTKTPPTHLSTALGGVFLLAIIQSLHYYLQLNDLARINNQFIFGLVGNNTLAIGIYLIGIIALLFYGSSLSRTVKLLDSSSPRSKYSVFIVLIITGASSNLLDRIFYAGVIDYFHFGNMMYFNLPDLLIILGLTSLLFGLSKITD